MKKCFCAMVALALAVSAFAQKIIVISDTHLCDKRMREAGLAWGSKVESDLLALLDYVESSGAEQLVLNGDIIDLWVSCVDQPTWADASNTPVSRTEYIKLIADANAEFFSKLKALKDKGIEIVYVPGNHDMTFYPDDWDTIAPGMVTYCMDAPGVGTYRPRPDIAIEHSHRYDFTNAPDPISHKLVFGEQSTGITPSTIFVCKLSTTKQRNSGTVSGGGSTYATLLSSMIAAYESKTETDELRRAYYALGMSMLSMSFLTYDLDAIPVCVEADDFGKGYVWKDYGWDDDNPLGTTLFPELYSIKNWAARCKANGATKPIPWARALAASIDHEYLDGMAFSQMLNDSDDPTRLVVFGHTHVPAMRYATHRDKGDVLYVNSGCWVDPERTNGTRTFVEMDLDDNAYTVKVRQLKSGNITTLGERVLKVGNDIDNGIKDAHTADDAASNTYNLQGIKVNAGYKGIVIQNGKKVLK